MKLIKQEDTERTFWAVLDQLDQGWSTRSFPHLISDRNLYLANNVVFNRDGLISKRPGNVAWASNVGGTGVTGSGVASQSGARFYPPGGTPKLLVQSGGKLYAGQDSVGTFTAISSSISSTNTARYQQMYDPDMSTGAAPAMFIVDGASVPKVWDGTNYVSVQTGTGGSGSFNYLPNNPGGSPITPAYVTQWKYHLVYAGEPTDPTAIYISDALRPERFNGYSIVDSAATPYTQYYPGGRDGTAGVITGISVVNQYLIIFYTSQIVVGYNTGTYGAYEFEFFPLTTGLGNIAPNSLVNFGGYIVFFGGDAFYATDGQNVVKIPDEIPSVYANTSASAFPSEMYNKNIVVGARRGDQYWASYDNVGNGTQTAIVVFDRAANGGWSFGSSSGGAWSKYSSGMPMSWGLECRGPGDSTFPFYWGSSAADQIGWFDTGVYSDFGNAITMEIQTKAFLLDNPITVKDVQSMWVVAAFPNITNNANFVVQAYPYVITDLSNPSQSQAPAINFSIQNSVALYGGGEHYGDGTLYGFTQSILTNVKRGQPPQDSKGYIFQCGIRESSTNAFNIVSIIAEVIVDNPQEFNT